jgi:hypothetical protein
MGRALRSQRGGRATIAATAVMHTTSTLPSSQFALLIGPNAAFVVVSNVPCSWLIFPCIDFATVAKNMFDHDVAFYALSYGTVTGVVVVVLVLGVIWASR